MTSDNLSEVWRDIYDFEGIYQVSNTGKIKALACKKLKGRYFHNCEDKLLAHSIEKRGYHRVTLCKNKKKYFKAVHQLVALYFIPNPENKPTVNHKDGDKSNNNDWNLEWSTEKEQISHADKMGLRNIKGENSKKSKLKESAILEIRNSSLSNKTLSKKFNTYETNIYKIKNKLSWKHI